MSVKQRLLDACVGHPHAKIQWPHRLLHDAVAEIERLEGEIQWRKKRLGPLEDYSKADAEALCSIAASAREGERTRMVAALQKISKVPWSTDIKDVRRWARDALGTNSENETSAVTTD